MCRCEVFLSSEIEYERIVVVVCWMITKIVLPENHCLLFVVFCLEMQIILLLRALLIVLVMVMSAFSRVTCWF